MKIEWASSFRPDGSRRKPPPSTMHGWLAKMRGTLLGDEDLRSRGMREMRDARAWRKLKRDREKRTQGSRSILALFRVGPGNKTATARSKSRGGNGTRRAKTLSRSRPSRSSTQTSTKSSQRPKASTRVSSTRHSGQNIRSPPPTNTRRLSRR